jgi:hypothetical protein
LIKAFSESIELTSAGDQTWPNFCF